jgi:RNA-directed DNA polymerase
MVWEAYKKVKANKGSAGVDRVSLEEYEIKLEDNLYKLWNRLSSGSYFPLAVKEVEIPKGEGKTRKLGIPTVGDRIAQMVIKMYIEPRLEAVFHDSSYGYRPGRNQHMAIERAKVNCWKYDWVIDLDIKGFFDEIDHENLNKALDRHCEEKWVRMYITRWLECPIQKRSGELVKRDKGTPQGGVISPLLANVYLHYSLDKWMETKYSQVPFERFADDIIIHCKSEEEAVEVLERIRERLSDCKLELHPDKTRIVYCRDGKRKRPKERPVQFTFLGFDFKSRRSKNRHDGSIFYSFTPAISKKREQMLTVKLRKLNISRRTRASIEELAEELNPKVSGWINYYGKFRRSAMRKICTRVNERLVKWIWWKHKKFKRSWKQAWKYLHDIQQHNLKLFTHWKYGFTY